MTGVGGFTGRHLARQLLGEGWEVSGTIRTRPSGVEGVDEHRLEIDDRDALARVVRDVKPDVIHHLASIVDTVSTPDVMTLYRSNLMGTVAVTEAMRDAESEARLVYASSAFVYGATVLAENGLREDQELLPLTPYGATKVGGEATVAQFGRETGAEVVIARPFQQTGPGHVGVYAMADWARQLAAIAAGGAEPVLRVGNLDAERDYLDVRDVAAAYRALAASGRPGEAYNVASGVPRTMRSLLEGLVAAYGVEVEIQVDEGRVRGADQPAFYGDPSKIRAHTGWRPGHSIEDTLAALAAFHRQAAEAQGTAATMPER